MKSLFIAALLAAGFGGVSGVAVAGSCQANCWAGYCSIACHPLYETAYCQCVYGLFPKCNCV